MPKTYAFRSNKPDISWKSRLQAFCLFDWHMMHRTMNWNSVLFAQ